MCVALMSVSAILRPTAFKSDNEYINNNVKSKLG